MEGSDVIVGPNKTLLSCCGSHHPWETEKGESGVFGLWHSQRSHVPRGPEPSRCKWRTCRIKICTTGLAGKLWLNRCTCSSVGRAVVSEPQDEWFDSQFLQVLTPKCHSSAIIYWSCPNNNFPKGLNKYVIIIVLYVQLQNMFGLIFFLISLYVNLHIYIIHHLKAKIERESISLPESWKRNEVFSKQTIGFSIFILAFKPSSHSAYFLFLEFLLGRNRTWNL